MAAARAAPKKCWCCRANAPSPQRVLIHWADEAARAATLAVSASVLRHVSAEAVYLDIMPEHTAATERPHGMRALLDARSEAQAVHGLEMRTELRFGDVASELARQLGESPDQMLILGVSQIAGLAQRFGALLAAHAALAGARRVSRTGKRPSRRPP